MKLLTIIAMLFLETVCVISGAAAMAVTETGAAAATSAIVDVQSVSKGLLIPRMTYAQRMAMFPTLTPAAKGMLVYQTDGASQVYVYNGEYWATYKIHREAAATLSAGGMVTLNGTGKATVGGTANSVAVAIQGATSGSALPISMIGNGSVLSNLYATGLSPGAIYYIQANGSISTTPSHCTFGVAISTSSIFPTRCKGQ